ncbi:hypothetical protein L6452_28219 [Arctium lappa]|uniref:Uncharacterized protein n=1 Tax=Arctium lappa TaxID=4217 RepID=A0ACB8ZYC6_ARCLA|nr:hypothetical protein L6452_28219 [Arctium lappa]
MVPILVFRSRRPLRLKTSSAEDFSIFRSRRPLSLKSRRPLSLQEPEDLFGNQRLLNLQGMKISSNTLYFLTKYIVISCIDVDLIWRSEKVSHAFNAWGTINMEDDSTCKITSSQAFKLSKCTTFSL